MYEKILTIAIPTFERPKALAECLSKIFPQCDSRVSIVVRDNHSMPSVEAVFIELSQQFPRVDAVYIRNKVNIGASANFLRCFEESRAKWMWVLGDDDIIKPDAVETIIKACTKWPNAALLGFVVEDYSDAAMSLFSPEVKADSLNDLLTKIGLKCISLISSAVYNVEKFMPLLEAGYRSSNTNYSHLAMLIRGYDRSDFYTVGLPTSIVNYSNAGHSESTWEMGELKCFFELQQLIRQETNLAAFRDCDLAKCIRLIFYPNGYVSEFSELLLLPLRSTTTTNLNASMVKLMRWKLNVASLTFRRFLYPIILFYSLTGTLLLLSGIMFSPIFRIILPSIRRLVRKKRK
jgi:glycosyltransferase involved in cell wall biosynthesis